MNSTECFLQPQGAADWKLKQFLTNPGRKQEKNQNLFVTVLQLLIVLKQDNGVLPKFSTVLTCKIVGSHVIGFIKSNIYIQFYLNITYVLKVA